MSKLEKSKIDLNKTVIEKAALACFLKWGFNGTSVRQIADAAEISLGNLYNYYPDKLSLFRSILHNLSQDFLHGENPMRRYLETCEFPADLAKLAAAIESSVDRYIPYFKMTYIDVVEFNGKHAGKLFSDVYSKFETILGERFKKAGNLGPSGRIDPCFAFVSVYLQFYYFYALKMLFGSKNVYGDISDKQVIQKLTELYTLGIGK